MSWTKRALAAAALMVAAYPMSAQRALAQVETVPASTTDLPPSAGSTFITGPLTESEALASVNAYLTGLDTLQGRFRQADMFGALVEGSFAIDRPGLMRFEYDDPFYPLLVSFADGGQFIVARWYREETPAEEADRIPLRDTPLNVLLAPSIDINKAATVTAVRQQPGQLWVTLEDTDGGAEGSVTLNFATPRLELRGWTTTDALGQEVTTAFLDVVSGAPVDYDLFKLDPRPRLPRRGR